MRMNNCHIKVEQAMMNDSDEPCTMLSFLSGFDETDAMFLEFANNLNYPAEGSSSVDDHSSTVQPSLTPTLRRRAQS
ncbi:cytochrome P450 CYP82D47-like [Cucumis melo var. makuwa]|uniref:Cytochrome P450 CYP82D47-like n=1 Tax=Cucumis melo var. makuwa TaxID=1194695 RepID=A0A5A7T4V1_CUCMM|nr:cytochrome P450 CYP82D47-like [Cucumis melo var. makuwa]TYK13906.1 cytochrome P450 CYP82D47-like [Cucumis melo var. makuwa]